MTNNLNIVPSTFEKLAQHPNIVGCKFSHGNIPDHTLVASSPKIDPKSFAVFTGFGQNLLPVLTVGGQGTIDGLANVFPAVTVRIFDKFQEAYAKGASRADLEELRSLQFRTCQGEKIVEKWGTVGIKEAIARLWGFGDKEGARLPLAGGFQGGEGEWNLFKDVFDGLKELEEKFQKETSK